MMQQTKHILIIENDDNDIELTLMALAEYNLDSNAAVVRDGVEALDYLFYRRRYINRPRVKPDVILLDLKMPKIDGLEVLRQIKKDPELRAIPVVALTSSRENRDIIRSYKLGVNAYVVKPVIFTDFIEAVERLGSFWLLTNEPPYTHKRPV
jgi:CheY-like chemotaxis protein